MAAARVAMDAGLPDGASRDSLPTCPGMAGGLILLFSAAPTRA
jgi:hypothetical protein